MEDVCTVTHVQGSCHSQIPNLGVKKAKKKKGNRP